MRGHRSFLPFMVLAFAPTLYANQGPVRNPVMDAGLRLVQAVNHSDSYRMDVLFSEAYLSAHPEEQLREVFQGWVSNKGQVIGLEEVVPTQAGQGHFRLVFLNGYRLPMKVFLDPNHLELVVDLQY